jgi:hypothetical protein
MLQLKSLVKQSDEYEDISLFEEEAARHMKQ